MLKTLMISAAISALMVSGAMAQATPPAPTEKKADAAPLNDPKFVSSQSTEQWVFSKFKGTDVIGPDSAQIGSVNDVLFDKSGKILAFIVGVGGFLGIGEKSVAIDMSAFQVMPADTATTGAGGNMAAKSSGSNDPTSVKLKVSWTKEQLKNAPDFQYYKPPSRTSSGPGGGTGMAPRPSTSGSK
jgi:sporulation protein YlmC with PRC-barrel domain